jgi:hypothetical protein
VDNPKIVLMLGSVGLFLNIVSLFFLHGTLDTLAT